MWSIEDGVLKSHGLLEEWGADLETEKEYQDYVLLVDFRMPTKSDSGIHFRNLAPATIGEVWATRSSSTSRSGRRHGAAGELPLLVPEKHETDRRSNSPKSSTSIRRSAVWHTVKLTVVGKTVTAELDGEVILDQFEYPEGMLGQGPQSHPLSEASFYRRRQAGRKEPVPDRAPQHLHQGDQTRQTSTLRMPYRLRAA